MFSFSIDPGRFLTVFEMKISVLLSSFLLYFFDTSYQSVIYGYWFCFLEMAKSRGLF